MNNFLKGFIQTSFIDWKKHLSSVIFTGGCNFRCPYCHNKDLVLGHKDMESVPVDYIYRILRKYKNWTDHVVITGGEPTIHADHLLELITALKNEGFYVKLDTNGSCPDVLHQCIKSRLVDYIAMDAKGPVSTYSKWAGVNVDSKKIEESIAAIIGSGIDHEFRMTVVPYLHQEEDIQNVAQMLKDAQNFYVQRFRPTVTLNEDYQLIPQQPVDEFQIIKEKYEKENGCGKFETKNKNVCDFALSTT